MRTAPPDWIPKRAAKRGEICDETTMIESSSGNFACAQIGIDPITGQHESAAPSCHGLLPESAVSMMRNSHLTALAYSYNATL